MPRHDPALPHAGDNIRVDVELIASGDLLPMTAVFTKMGIYNLAVSDDRPSQRWRAKYSPFDEPKGFFWGSADGGNLQSIVDEYATALAPIPQLSEKLSHELLSHLSDPICCLIGFVLD